MCELQQTFSRALLIEKKEMSNKPKSTVEACPYIELKGTRIRIDIPPHDIERMVNKALNVGAFQAGIRREIRDQVREIVNSEVSSIFGEMGLSTETQQRNAMLIAIGQFLHAREGWFAKQIAKTVRKVMKEQK